MKKELDQQLCEQFPLLYKDRNGSPTKTCMYWGIAIGDGWHKIILDLSTKLELLIQQSIDTNPRKCEHCDVLEIDHNKESDPTCSGFSLFHPKASQVKEKFGGLRFYMNCATKEMSDLIQKAEALSYKTCEVCGEPGNLDGKGWAKVKCESCNLKNAKTW